MVYPGGNPDIVEKGKNTRFTNGSVTAIESGKKSGESRRRNKVLKEIQEIIGALPVSSLTKEAYIKDIAKEHGFDIEMTNDVAMICALYKKALEGDVPAIRELWDRKEGKPTQHIENEPRLFSTEVEYL